MKSTQAKSCFDDILRILRKYEELQENTQTLNNGLKEGLAYWKKRGEAAEATLRILAGEGQSKADLIAERDALRQKVVDLSREHAELLEALHKVTTICGGHDGTVVPTT